MKNIGSMTKIAVAGLYLLTIIFFFLTFAWVEMGVKVTSSGFVNAFGGDIMSDGIAVGTAEGDTVTMLTFILVCIGLIVAALLAFKVLKLDDKVANYVLIAVTAVIFALFVYLLIDALNDPEAKLMKEMGIDFGFGIGFWGGLVFSVLALGASIFGTLKAKQN